MHVHPLLRRPVTSYLVRLISEERKKKEKKNEKNTFFKWKLEEDDSSNTADLYSVLVEAIMIGLFVRDSHRVRDLEFYHGGVNPPLLWTRPREISQLSYTTFPRFELLCVGG